MRTIMLIILCLLPLSAGAQITVSTPPVAATMLSATDQWKMLLYLQQLIDRLETKINAVQAKTDKLP